MGFLKQLFEKKEKETMIQKSDILYSPVSGTVIPLSEVDDPVFSQEIMGKGVGIRPTEGKLYAPINGTVATVFPTGHAIGIETDEGVEVLLHIGIDTVSLNGKGFHKVVNQGDRVNVGDLLVEFNSEEIKNAGLKDTTMMLVTNQGDYTEVKEITMGDVQVGDELISLN